MKRRARRGATLSNPLANTDDIDTIREKIREARLAQGLTQEQLAEKAGVSQRTVSAIERGGMDPSLKTLLVILGALGLGFVLYQLWKGGTKGSG